MIRPIQIINGEGGLSVRIKLNSLFSELITGSEGINALWAALRQYAGDIEAYQNTMESNITTINEALNEVNNLITNHDNRIRVLERQSGGGNEIVIDIALSTTSENAVQNRVVTRALNGKSPIGHTHDIDGVQGLRAINNNFDQRIQFLENYGVRGKYLIQVEDISTYTPTVEGEIIHYTGPTQDGMVHGYTYQFRNNRWEQIDIQPQPDLTEIQQAIANFNSFLNEVDSADSTINKWRELNSFLSGITDQQTLGGILLALKDEINIAIAAKQDKLSGTNGDVIYHNGTDLLAQSLMAEGFVVTDNAELIQCMNVSPSFEEVFRTWRKFSHLNANDNAVAADINNWYYDSERNTVVQPNNSTSYAGFVSPKKYSTYDITVRVYSTNSDDDTIGLVAAFAVDGNGKEHTLSFVRGAGGTGATWVCIVDLRSFSLTSTANGQFILVNKSATAPSPTQNWSQLGTGSVINMTRSGNTFTARCSQFDSTELDNTTLITIDLDDLCTQNPSFAPVLSLFKGSAQWGYSTFSQSNSMYENIAIPNDSKIFDLENDNVQQYNFNTRQWEVLPNATPISEIGVGRFSYNSITKKLFFCKAMEVVELSQVAEESGSGGSSAQVQANWNETNNANPAFIRNKPTVPCIRFISAASIQNDMRNIDTSAYHADDLIVIKDPSATLIFLNGSEVVTLYDIPFEPTFRWSGTGFKPMFNFL